ncbi:phosphopantetheine-binding protein [Photorhabdus temperata]|uniref:phosphopantetheine-binding protein n=1 Tax=Photorhabdus temperata TaxID=574560 RepID=UPI003B75C569
MRKSGATSLVLSKLALKQIFFALGGDSLLAIQIIAEAEKKRSNDRSCQVIQIAYVAGSVSRINT